MSLKDVADHARAKLSTDEVPKGAFIGNCMPSLTWYILLGPLAAMMMKQYWITITDKRIYFTRLNMLQKPLITDSFEYSELGNTVIKGKLLSRHFWFNLSGKKMKLIVPFRKNPTPNSLDPEILEFIESKLK